MQGSEALTRLIAIADRFHETMQDAQSKEERDQFEQGQLAVSVAQAMLNTALPIARFRCHVTIDKVKEGSKIAPGDDFTVCGTSVKAIKNGLVGLAMEAIEVHASLWEQRPTGADMISGYQGSTKTMQYRLWLKEIEAWNAPGSFKSSTMLN